MLQKIALRDVKPALEKLGFSIIQDYLPCEQHHKDHRYITVRPPRGQDYEPLVTSLIFDCDYYRGRRGRICSRSSFQTECKKGWEERVLEWMEKAIDAHADYIEVKNAMDAKRQEAKAAGEAYQLEVERLTNLDRGRIIWSDGDGLPVAVEFKIKIYGSPSEVARKYAEIQKLL